MKKETLKNIFLFGIALTTILFTGCEDPQYPDPVPASGASTNTARVQFTHASPGVGPLNFFANNNQIGVSQSYLGTTGYSILNVGSTQFRGKAAAGTIGGTLEGNDIIFRAGATNNTNFSLVTGRNYTVFAGDLASRARPTQTGATDPGGVRFIVVEDNLTAPAGNNAGVRFIHLSPTAPTVWVTTAPGTVFAGISNRTFAFSAAAGSRTLTGTASAFASVAAGSVNIQVRTGSATGTAVLSLTGITLEAGKLYTIYARGLVAGTGNDALGATIIQHN
jgi:hypothetical protein